MQITKKSSAMKRLLMLFVFTFFAFATHAQTWQWAKRMGGDSQQSPSIKGFHANGVYDLAVDAQLNTYALAEVASKLLDVDGHPITGYGNKNILLSSFDCAGKYRWSKVIGSSSDSDEMCALKLDNSGGVYVSGILNLTASSGVTGAHIGADTFIGNTNKMMFLAKFDTAGNYQWFRMPQPDTISHYSAVNSNLLIDMDFDGQNMCLLAYITKGLYGGHIDVPSTGLYLLKYDKLGVFQSALSLPIILGNMNPRDFVKTGLRYNPVKQQFIVSGWSSSISSVTKTIGTTVIPPASGFVAGFNATNGSVQFVTFQNAFPRTGGLIYPSATVDSKGDIYSCGYFYDSCEIAGQRFYNGVYASGIYSPILLKLNGSTGGIIWAVSGRSYGQTDIRSTALVNNKLYAVGRFSNGVVFGTDSVVNDSLINIDQFLLQLDPVTGAVLQLDSVQISKSQSGVFGQLTPFGKYSFISYGAFYGNLAFGSTLLQQNLKGTPGRHSLGDGFLAKYGYPDCQTCSEMPASFTSTYLSGNTFQYRFTGSIVAVDSIRWAWGDGKQQTVKSNFTNKLSHTFAGKGAYSVCVTVYADTCSIKQYCNTSKLSVGTNAVNALKIYPNPTTGILALEGLEIGAELHLQSIVGQSLLRQKVTSEKQTISLDKFPQGTYLLRVIFKNGTSSFAKLTKW